MAKQNIKYKRTILSIQRTAETILRNIALFGIALGAILFGIIFYYKGLSAIPDILINILATIMGGLFIFFIWDKITGILQDEKQSKLIDDVLESINGLRKLSPEEAFKKACNAIDNLSYSTDRSIRVIGSSKSPVKDYIVEYYKKTEDYLLRENGVKYRRITSYAQSNELKTHINCLFDQNATLKNDIQVMLRIDFVQTHNYIVLGDQLLLLVLSYDENGTLQTKTFCTENSEIIHSYINHFQNVWKNIERKEKIAKSKGSFTQLLSYYRGIEKAFAEIKNAIYKVETESTLLLKHITLEIAGIDDYFNAISNGVYEINHHKTQNELLRTFCMYLDNLNEQYSFYAISFYQFWINLLALENSNTRYNFIQSNEQALQKQTTLKRILVIDERLFQLQIADDHIIFDGIKKGEYRDGISKIIKANIDMHIKYPRYEFKLLFTLNHEKMRNEFINFALIERFDQGIIQEAVLFEAAARTTSDITKWIYYTAGNPINQNLASRISLGAIQSKKKDFEKIADIEWKNQYISQEHKIFLTGICPAYFSIPENFNKHLPV